MKYFSKHSNYRVVLVPGQPAERSTGRPMQPGLYVKFEDGMADIKDTLTDMIKMMNEHPMYGIDFIRENHQGTVNFTINRQSIEPEHTIMDIKHGSVGASVNARPAVRLTPDQKKLLNEMALEMAKQMAPELAKEIALKAVNDIKESKQQEIVNNESVTSVQAPEETSPKVETAKSEKESKSSETVKSAN